MKTTKVPGKNSKHRVLLYALSTCAWCKRTKKLLIDHGIEYEYVDVDLCSDEDRDEIHKDIERRGARPSYPIVIVDDKEVIIGFREDAIKEALGI